MTFAGRRHAEESRERRRLAYLAILRRIAFVFLGLSIVVFITTTSWLSHQLHSLSQELRDFEGGFRVADLSERIATIVKFGLFGVLMSMLLCIAPMFHYFRAAIVVLMLEIVIVCLFVYLMYATLRM